MDPITPGDRGDAVQDVQRRLRALGHAVDGDDPGTFGPATAAAVRQFQQERRLTADGIVGHDTWTALLDAGWELGDRLLYLTRPWLRGDDVRRLQKALSRLGFDTGVTDGIHGPDTDAALRDFQHNIGLPVDGIAGRRTLDQLATLWRAHQAATSFEVIERHGAQPARSLAGLHIMVDPALGPAASRHDVGGMRDHEITYDVARRLRGHLVAFGAQALLSRAEGATPPPSERARLANDLDVDALVSIAVAAMPGSDAKGVASYYFGDGEVMSERGRRLADHCVDEVATRLDTDNCQAHASTSAILRESRCPAASVEIGFVTHPSEGPLLASSAHRQAAASALAAGVRRWAAGA